MGNYDCYDNRAPWYSQRESIKTIIIENGIKDIGSYAFYYCTSLTSITIPYSVTNIGRGAFYGCSSLTSVTVPNGETNIDSSTFYGCNATVSPKTELCVEDITNDLEFEDGYCDSKGYKGLNRSYKHTCMIPCKAGDIFKTLNKYTSYRYITAYSGNTIISENGAESVYSYTVPEGVDGIIITIYANQSTIEKTIIKKSHETVNVNSEHIQNIKERKARVTIIDDDGYAEFYQYFVPLMRKYGIPICTAYMGDVSPNMADSRYMSKKQLDEVVALGGEVIVHGGNSLTSFATVEEAEENVLLSKNSLKKNGFDSNIYVYPNSGNNVAIREMISKHFDCAFKTASPQKYDNRTNDKCVPHYFIHRSSCGGYYDDKSPLYGNYDTHTIEYFQALVNDCVERKSWLVFMSHVWMMPSACSWRTNPSHANEVYAWKGDGTDLDEFALFEQIIQYILSLKQQGIDIEIVTASEGFNMFRNVHQSGDYLGYWNNDIRDIQTYQHREPGRAINALGESDGFKDDNEYYEIYKNITDDTSVGDGLTSIGDYSFSGCRSLQKVALGENLATIGTHAFEDCSSLTKISIPKKVTSIGDYAFSGCHSLTDVTIADRTECIHLGSNGSSPLFADCPLNTIYLGGQLSYNTSVCSGYSPFYCNNNLQSVIVADTEEQIYDNEFYGCTNLINIKIGDGVRSIGNRAFYGCVSLQNLSLGNNTHNIGKEAFSNCSNLNSVTIPNSVTFIGDMAFHACSNLKNITIYVNQDLSIGLWTSEYTNIEKLVMYGETLPASTNTDLATCLNKATLYVPSSLYDEYCSTSPWYFFRNIVKIPDSAFNLTDGETFTNKEERNKQSIEYTRNYSNTKWQALYIPFSMSYNDWKEDFEVAYINNIRQLDKDDDGVIDETIMDIVKITNGSLIPNTPYLIRAKNTGEYTIKVTDATLYKATQNSIDCRTTIAEYTFTGTYDTIPASTLIANDYYAMGGGSLVMTDGTSNLKPYRWYMKIESRSPMYNIYNNAKSITISVIGKDEETTGIINTIQPSPNTQIYDLNGQKVNEYTLKPGLYIKNGKKIIIK